jgi:fatty-acyl-CoA synthase
VLGIQGLASVYGLTECCGYSCVTGPDDPREVRMQTQGRVIDSQELRIGEGDRPLGVGETGEIQLRGAILSSYLDPEMTAQAFTADGWFRTNDLGWLDGDGRLHFVGRRGEMIKTKGINVSPAQVEDVVRGVDGVREVYVFGVADDEAGELVAAVVVPADASLTGPTPDASEARAALARAVMAAVRARLASYNVPRDIEVVAFEDLPLTLSGKVNRRQLRDLAEGRRRGAKAMP